MKEKLGLGIVAFDDTLHLRNIISEIRDLCDDVVICLQEVSYHGDHIKENVVNEIKTIKDEGLIDKIIWFEETKEYDESLPETPRVIETDKRNFILDTLENRGCTHALVIDSDEFYDHDDFKKAKELVYNDENIKVSYCQYVNYYRDYRHVMVWPFEAFVPFISEIKFRFDFKEGNFTKPSDPTRRYKVEDGKFCIFNWGTIKMHHLSWIRKNIEDKVENWSAKKYFEDADNLKERILERYYNYKDGQNAILMFGVPNHEVVVTALPDQYIHPKYNLLDL